MCLRFYSRLPSGNSAHQLPSLDRMAPALPFASIIIGSGPALLLVLGTMAGLPPLFAAGLALAFSALITGAMAEDALADAADGLFGGQTIARRLEILKDSRHGTYGVTALVLFLILRVTALGAMATISPLAAGCVWLAAGISARSGALWLTLILPAARPDGASASTGQVSIKSFIAGAVFTLLLAFVFAAPFTSILGFTVALVLLVVVSIGWARLCAHLVGGQTGDLIGALQALLEIAALSAFILFIG